MPRCAVALKSRFQKGMIVAWHGCEMSCVNQTRPHCVNEMGKTQYKPLAAWHGRGTAWARYGNGMECVNWPLLSGNFGALRGSLKKLCPLLGLTNRDISSPGTVFSSACLACSASIGSIMSSKALQLSDDSLHCN
jgi:hypothetical protein